MINLKLNNQTINFDKPMTIKELSSLYPTEQFVVGGILNGKVHDMTYVVSKNGNFEWIFKDSEIGQLMMERTLSFVFLTALNKVLPHASSNICHTISSGLYITVEPKLDQTTLDLIKAKMNEIIKNDTPILRKVISKEEAIQHYNALGMVDKAELLRQRTSQKCSIYTCLGYDNYFYGVMAEHAGLIQDYTLSFYQDGIWLSFEKEIIEQPKLFEVFKRFEKRGQEVGITAAWQLNNKIKQGKLEEIIELNEKRVSYDLDQFVQKIIDNEDIQVILIAGPSSAGKTTTSKKICEKLENKGYPSLTLAMDDFFVERELSPKLPDGSYDFENIECVDLKLFNDTINQLISLKETKLPTFDFKTGTKQWNNEPVTITKDTILIIEGIHALNPRTYEFIDKKYIIKLYINALTHLNYDCHNRISTTDYRKIRRMTRDAKFRGRSVSETINGWSKVTDGEEKYIYPYQEEADVIINTSMDYELPILKVALYPLLNQVSIEDPAYIEANRIKKLLEYFVDGDPELVPNNSILKEFLGGSIYTG